VHGGYPTRGREVFGSATPDCFHRDAKAVPSLLMPKASRSKSPPDMDALLAGAMATLDREKTLARSSVGPAAVRDQLLARLRARGYEITPKVVRMPLSEQLESALTDGSYIALKAVGAHVRGATATEARKAALLLLERGRARLALRSQSETLVPATADVVAGRELAAVATRVADLAKQLQKAVRKGKGAGVLRADLRDVLDAGPALRAQGTPRTAEPTAALPRVLRAVDKARDAALGLSFVPKIVALLAPDLEPNAAKKALLEAASRGLVELRPEGGLGRLTDAERQACPEGPQGTRLPWARRIEVHA
jgi:hypothetical protein